MPGSSPERSLEKLDQMALVQRECGPADAPLSGGAPASLYHAYPISNRSAGTFPSYFVRLPLLCEVDIE